MVPTRRRACGYCFCHAFDAARTWASRTSLFNEMLVGNDADYQRAFEAAQALIQDAELDIRGENADGTACSSANCRENRQVSHKSHLKPKKSPPC